MRLEQWHHFKAAAKRRNRGGPIPLALIVDCPWIPGYAGISHWDYFFDPEAWLEANLRVQRDFPEVIWFPSWWSEMGMGAEPSALGTRMRVYPNHIPDVEHLPFPMDELDKLTLPDPKTDGYMPLCLYRFAKLKDRIRQAGFIIPVVAARGPLTIASFFRGVTELMTDIVDHPERTLKLFELTTQLAIGWLKAQIEVIGDEVEGILVLDDITGFIGRKHYEQFAHPFLQRICDAFPPDWVKVFHNDASVAACLDLLPETGFDALNWGVQPDMTAACARVNGRLCLMGNVPPLDLGVRGTPEQVYTAALNVLHQAGDHPLILSWGGATTIGTPPENIRALAQAVREFNGQRHRS
ncbi:MAG: uroporphyrinogen decarboxylase family protein [Verrucomicrobiota bacterium]